MSATIRGKRELEARLRAIGDTSKVLRKFAPEGLRQIKIETPRKTGNLGRNNSILSVSDTEVRYGNRANYAAPVHEGSRPHDIVPKRAKALRFAASPGGARLTGTPRSGSQVVFAKRVRHPGNKANPWMARGIRLALDRFGFGRFIVKVWDEAS